MIVGNRTPGAPHDLPAGQAYFRQVYWPHGGAHAAYLTAYLDGQGAGADQQPAMIQPLLYDDAGRLLTTGPAVGIPAGAAAGWVMLRLDSPGLLLPGIPQPEPIGLVASGIPWLGVRASGANLTARLYALTGTGATAYTLPAVTGPPPTVAGGTISPLEGTLIAEALAPWRAPDVDDAALARLPWNVTQDALAATGPTGAPRFASAGWHGPDTDAERPAFCIARSDGPLADLVGERLRVTRRTGTLERSVSVYCHDEQAFPAEAAGEDLSLTRRAFLALAPLWRDSLPVEVLVLR